MAPGLHALRAKPTQYRNAAEALLRRLAKHGDVPAISTLVDIGNLVSLRRALPVAVIDLAGIAGGITVRFATGAERFSDLGGDHGVAAAKEDLVALLDEFQAGHTARSWQLAPARR